MYVVERTLPTLPENLALDEALLLEAEAGRSGEVLRLWEWQKPAVVLGAGCRLSEDVDEDACRADGVPIFRRSSGGGTVLQGSGCLSYSLVLAYDRSPGLHQVRTSYAFILDRIREKLSDVLPGIERVGTSDLAVAGRKFSGNAQQRKRSFLLHHGTILYGFNISLIGHYLRLPARQPDYRQDRDHAEFLMNLAIDQFDLKRRLRIAWGAGTDLPGWPKATVHQLVADKYTRQEWIRRR